MRTFGEPEKPLFSSRAHAGTVLADRLIAGGQQFGCVVAIPNGGSVVAEPIAVQLGLQMLACGVSRIVAPGTRDLGIGAVLDRTGRTVLNNDVVHALSLSLASVEGARDAAYHRLKGMYDDAMEALLESSVAEQRVLLVDDGVATGITMASAGRLIVELGASEVVAATPVVSSYGYRMLVPHVSDIAYIYYDLAPQFRVDAHYHSFPDVSACEAQALFERRHGRAS